MDLEEQKEGRDYVEDIGAGRSGLERPIDDSSIAAETHTAYLPVGGIELTDEERKLDRRVNLKFDVLILPILVVLYMFNGIDRGNIGNAATVDFIQDAGLSPDSINNANSFFFCTFIPLQPVSAAFGKWIGVTRWLPGCMFFWGCFTLITGFVHGDGMFYALRLLIGVFESGFYPMATFYISTLYPRFSLGLRVSIYYGSYTIAGAFSGLIAYGLLQLNSSKLHDWQYLFIIEGSITMAVGLFAFFYLPGDTSQAWFLTAEEKNWAVERMIRDMGSAEQSRQGLGKREILAAVTDWKPWTILPGNITSSVPFQAFSVFLPIIVEQLGYESYHANLFSVPVYAIGICGVWATCYSSDRFKERTLHILFAITVMVVGLALAGNLSNPKGRYAALCLTGLGSWTVTPLVATSLMNNTPNPGQRSIIMAIQGWGNLGGVIASELYRPQFAPSYKIPFQASLGLLCFAWIAYAGYRVTMMHKNRKRQRITALWSPEEIREENTTDTRIGDKKYTFVYTY